jgi:outer membrane protein assembly factor BamB
MGASLTTGALLWNVTTNHIFYSTSTAVADHGRFTVRMLDGVWICWDLQSGREVWTSDDSPYPWGDFGAYTIASYGGLVYDFSYAGIYALRWEDGSIAWNFTAPSAPFESPWYPTMGWFSNSPSIADGKLYYANGEHSPTQPLARGWKLWCLDASTGQELWNFSGGGSAGAVADGYLTYDNRYDGNMYVFGIGKTQTTVTAPEIEIVNGQKAIISGTILDLSPGQPNTACVSADTMGPWMEYLHTQAAMPSNGTGVPISIDAVDPNNNYVHIATVTSDLSGTYSYTWTPEITGDYSITATFAGDVSYGSSWAETHATVIEAAATTQQPTTTPLTMPPYELYTVGTGIAVIIALAVAVLILRKKP